MAFTPLVSIIIPVYNGSNYLGEAIGSAITQTYQNIEVIVVNDGSNDNGATRNVALSYGTQIRYFEKRNGGVSSAFNFGLRNMKGEYFSWLSHDDIYHLNKVEEQIAVLAKLVDKDTIVYSNQDYIDKNSNPFLDKKKTQKINNDHILLYILFKRPIINGNTVLIHKSCFEKVGYFDESLKASQDYDMWFRLAEYFKFYYVDKTLIRSRIHLNQSSKTARSIFILESIQTKTKMIEKIQNRILSISGERNERNFYIKLTIKYILNGGDKKGWPVNYCLEILNHRNYEVSFYLLTILYTALSLKVLLKLFNFLYKNLLTNLFSFKNEN